MWNVVYDYLGYSLPALMSCPWFWAAGGKESIFLLPGQYKVACEQALLLGRASSARAFSLARLASLAKIGELARRQNTSEKRPLLAGNVDKSGRSITITRCFVGLTTIDR